MHRYWDKITEKMDKFLLRLQDLSVLESLSLKYTLPFTKTI